MMYLPEIAPAGLLVIEPAELPMVQASLGRSDRAATIGLLILGELAQILRARALGIRGDPLELVRILAEGERAAD